MHFRKVLTGMSMSIATCASAHAAEVPDTPQYDHGALAQVEALYGLTEDGAISRLAREYEAAVQARRVEERGLSSFAGAWFDSATQRLHVAASSKQDFDAIDKIGAVPVLVSRSLRELEQTKDVIAGALTHELGSANIRLFYVDFRTNSVVVGVRKSAMEQAAGVVAASAGLHAPVRLTEAATDIEFSTNLLGADGTQNATWYGTDGQVHPCSAGAAAEKVSTSYVAGFATAGHCGWATNVFQSTGGTNLGSVAWSSLNSNGTFTNHEDGAWVSTYTGWTPQAQINGYSDGTLNVSGTWAGTLQAPVGTTVCRYGSASGGPHCASVSHLNVSQTFGTVRIDGLIEVDGVCTDDGDSGGPLVTPALQVQGTDTGGSSNSCPDSSGDVTYYYPISTTLSLATTGVGGSPVAMLTSHGRSAPTVSTFACPDMANSGGHAYTCDYSSYDSQGKTDNSWTSNTGNSSTTSELSGTCSTGQVVNVTLAISNPYGTTYKYASFNCPTNPPP